MIEDQARFDSAIALMDKANEADPHQEEYLGKSYPKELLYAGRMTSWLNALYPDASEALQLAARSQHICRWEIPRDTFPDTRVGYLEWRNRLKEFHAEKTAGILRSTGYDQDLIDRVAFLLQKKKLRKDEGTQKLEDVICLVFIQYYLEDFSKQHPDDKVVDILQKTWRKMSPTGQEKALAHDFPDPVKQLLHKALDLA